MRIGGGKSKGNRFENHVARSLSLWVTEGTDATQLIPSRLSGGWRFGQSGSEAWRQVGDLAPNGPAGEELRRMFGVECKHHRTVDLWDLWTYSGKKDKNTLLGWWNRLQMDCAAVSTTKHTLHPLVVFRANFRPVMVALPMGIVRLERGRVAVPEYEMDLLPFETLLAYPLWEQVRAQKSVADVVAQAEKELKQKRPRKAR